MNPLRANFSFIGLFLAFAQLSAQASPFDQCGYLECQTCTATGYLTLRADDGQTYQLTGLTQVARGLHRVRVTGGLNENCSVTCAPADLQGEAATALFESLADAMVGWVAQHFTGAQQGALAAALSDPELSFASAAGAAKAAEIVEQLNQ